MMAFARTSAALALALPLSACTASARDEAPAWASHVGSAIEVVERRAITAPSTTVGEEYERGQPEIDHVHQRVYMGSSDRGLYALRADDLTTVWRFQTAGYVQCEPLYDEREDVVYFGSNDGALYKVAASDGHLLWRFASNSEIARRPVLYGGLAYAVNANDTLVALDPATGALRWHVHRTPALGMEIAGYAGPSAAWGRVYTAFSDGRVSAYDASSGQERWTTDLGEEAEQQTGDTPRYLDVDTTPIPTRISAGPVVFVAGFAAGVFALDAETGTRVWSNPRAVGTTELALWEELPLSSEGSGASQPRRRYLIASSGSTGMWALSAEDGREVWHRQIREGGLTRAVPVAGALMVGSSRYGLFLLSATDGLPIDGLGNEPGFAMTPAAYGRRAFAMTNRGVAYAMHIDGPTRGRTTVTRPLFAGY
jgi:outer membrane protein assembly factor BamB